MGLKKERQETLLDSPRGFNPRSEFEPLSTIQLLHYITMQRPIHKRHLEVVLDIAAERIEQGDTVGHELHDECQRRLDFGGFT